MRGVALLGSTGSIGRSALNGLDRHADEFRIVALAANRNARELAGPIPGDGDAASEAELELLRRAAHRANEDHRRVPR